MALPAPVRLLPGQFQHPTDGQIIDIQPTNDEGPKPTNADFDPFNFSPPALEAKKAKSDAPDFDSIKSITTRHDTSRKDTSC